MEKITIKRKLPRPQLTYNGVTGDQMIDVESLADVSDGYHTIAELYDHRITLFIALCRIVQDWVYPPGARNVVPDGYSKRVVRSKKHHDGSSFEGWFILMMDREKGKQKSYHLPLSRWDETDFAETLDKAPEWDGHTSADVLERLKTL